MTDRPAGCGTVDDAPAPRHRLLAFPPRERRTVQDGDHQWEDAGVGGQHALQQIAGAYPYLNVSVILLNRATDFIAAGELDNGGHLPISEYAVQFYMVIEICLDRLRDPVYVERRCFDESNSRSAKPVTKEATGVARGVHAVGKHVRPCGGGSAEKPATLHITASSQPAKVLDPKVSVASASREATVLVR
ncbi:hypothetical protein FA13DRAFT_1708281 [Coprinellus micaceus]|uniref:Uncharacterized protein n=1 Tax=Coprinellus micaceus TaxID=71717 RepID=A0A4Y7THL7_COPMI|nr:hypothetical protein FA13DRAFT_1708281 [Coprinellus micaceus]